MPYTPPKALDNGIIAHDYRIVDAFCGGQLAHHRLFLIHRDGNYS